jgi:hypothetical protein
MMVNTMDMSAPVTRGELREELDRAFEQRLGPLVTKEYLEQRLEPLVTKEYLENRLEPLVTKEYLENRLDERLEPLVTKEYLENRLDGRLAPLATKDDLKAMHTELSAELAQHVKSLGEILRMQVSVFDDKYMDLPGRVNRLEGAVFPADRPDDEPDARAKSKKERRSTPARSPKRR